MNTFYIDISSDKIYLSCNEEDLFLERNGIEDILGKVLVERYRRYNFKKAYILNWPGGFTNLRVGSLCMNLLNALVGDQIDFYAVSKIQLYTYEFSERSQHWQESTLDKVSPQRFGVIYIGQKRNIWLWDFEKGEKIWQLNFEQLEEMVKSEKYRKEDIFLDTVYDYDYYPDFLRTFLHISYTVPKQLMNEYMEAMKPQPTRNIVANYMIDPIITPKCT